MSLAVRQMVGLFARSRRRAWWALAGLVVATSAMEAAAASLVFALVDLLSSGSVDLPVVGTITTADGLPAFAAAISVTFLVRAALVVAHDTAVYRLAYGSAAQVERELLLGYLALPPREIRRRGHAELVRNVHDTVSTVVEDGLVPVVLALGFLLRAVGIVLVMMVVAPLQTLLAAAVFTPLLWAIARSVRGPVHRLAVEVEDGLADSLRVGAETLNLAADIRMAGRAAAFADRFGTIRSRLARASGTEEVLKGVPRLAAETVLVLFVVAYVAVATATGNGQDVLPTLGLFAYAALRVLPSLLGLVRLVHSIARTGPALEVVLADAPLLGRRPAEVGPAGAPGRLVLDGVSVRLPETGRIVLRDVDLVLSLGDVVAVTGPNGAGKSTLVDVLAGLLAPDSGAITVDGRPMAELDDQWGARVAMVPQHVHLLDADVRTNVTLDVGGQPEDDDRLRAVLSAVGLDPVVDRLAGASVGEDGRSLSGGERQRVAVARALHRSAGVLLVDEGTSALDTGARNALVDLVRVGHEERITVLVTHDPALTAACSRVVTVDAGRVTEQRRAGAPADIGPAARG